MSNLLRAADALRRSKRVFFTGAGISADSGIPTFRDKLTGLWAKHDPQRLETADAFRESNSCLELVSLAPTPGKPGQTQLGPSIYSTDS
jgi:NAD-dependent SIR2 family protein deacetylase